MLGLEMGEGWWFEGQKGGQWLEWRECKGKCRREYQVDNRRHFIDHCKSFDFAHTMGRDGKLLEGFEHRNEIICLIFLKYLSGCF